VSRGLARFLVLVPVAAWSLNFTAAKYALTHGFLPLAYTMPRFVFASAAFTMLAVERERSLRVTRRDLVFLAALGVVGIFLNQLSFVYALKHSSAATVALLFGVVPILAGLMSHLSGHEMLGRRQWAAAVISAGGVALVVLGASGGVSADGLGIVLALAAPLTWAAFSVGVVPLLRRYSPFRINAIACTIGTVPLALVSIGPLRDQSWSAPNLLAWLALIYGAVVAYVLATAIWLVAIRRIGATRASLYQNLQPFLGALFALVLLSEPISVLEIVGGVVIGSGIVVARRRAHDEPRAAAVEQKL
jgi:drug/metabolite transporter (DMT)-like permease